MGTLIDAFNEYFPDADNDWLGGFNNEIPEDPGQPGPGYERGLTKCAPPASTPAPGMTVLQARAQVMSTMRDYLDQQSPSDMLLLLCPPGSGKTWAAVATAEDRVTRLKQAGLYMAPRHDFWGNIVGDLSRNLVGAARNPLLWYKWLPHSAGVPALGIPRTCLFPDHLAAWNARGWKGLEFCEHNKRCGFSYMQNGCDWHAQEKRPEPLWMAQHQHLTTGIPRAKDFSFVIGDENPMSAFIDLRQIPAARIVPHHLVNMPDPLVDILRRLARLTETGQGLDGMTLLAALGGPQAVQDAISNFHGPVAPTPVLQQPSDALNSPYNHFTILARLLSWEAKAALAGQEYPHRIRTEAKRLLLVWRREVNQDLATKPTIWLDATGDPKLYQQLFRRDVQVFDPKIALLGRTFQISDRQNGKSSLVRERQSTAQAGSGPAILHELTTKADQLVLQTKEIVQRYRGDVALITHKSIRDDLARILPANVQLGHFGGQRGTNEFEHCEAIIIAGTPQPSLDDLDLMARHVYLGGPDAMKPFRNAAGKLPWTTTPRAYNYTDPSDGMGRAYPVGRFVEPNPERLNVILWQLREAEIIQAAHRARPILRPVDIWLLTNIPIDQLPPTELIPMRAIFGAPEGVEPWLWPRLRDIANARYSQGQCLTATEVAFALALDRRTAIRYLKLVAACESDRWMASRVDVKRTQGGGRDGFALSPRLDPSQTTLTYIDTLYANAVSPSGNTLESRPA